MGKTLENIARGLALASVLSFGGCFLTNWKPKVPEEDKVLYSRVYNMSETDWNKNKAEYQKFLDGFSKDREIYLKDAKDCNWISPKNPSERDRVYIVVRKMLADLEASYYQHGGIGGVIMVPDSKK